MGIRVDNMDLILRRNLPYRADGVFGNIYNEMEERLFSTLEHTFLGDKNEPIAIIPIGYYVCVRGHHKLDGMLNDFSTFEVRGVVGHSGLLFHWGNWNRDSKGCILIGKNEIYSTKGEMITNSKESFNKFMLLQEGVDMFNLKIEDQVELI